MSTSAGSSATPPGGHPLDLHRGKMGKMPDADVAAIAGVSVDEVKLYRREHNIAAFLRPPPGAAWAGPGNDARTVRLVRPVEAGATWAASAPASAVAPPGTAPVASPGTLEGQRDRLGRVADQVIADELGLSRRVVGAYRRKLGIEAYDGFRFTPGSRPTPTRPGGGSAPPARSSATPETPPAAREPGPGLAPSGRSSIDDYRALLGTVPDSKVAALAGVSRAAVAKYRARRGIAGVEPAPLILKNQDLPAPATDEPASGAPRPSKLDAHRAVVGVLTDREVGERVGVTPEAVRVYRKRHGIAAAWTTLAPKAQMPLISTEPRGALPPAAVPPTAESSSEAGLPREPVAPAAPTPPAVTAPTPELSPPPLATAAPAPAQIAPPAPMEPTASDVAEPRAFVVLAGRADERRRFTCVGADISQALGLAVRALAARRDGPWRVLAIRQDTEALLEPEPAAAPAATPAPSRPAGPAPVPVLAVGPAPASVTPAPHDGLHAHPGPVTGDDLARYRREHGLPQRTLGERLGVGQATISKLESGGNRAIPDLVAARFAVMVKAGP